MKPVYLLFSAAFFLSLFFTNAQDPPDEITAPYGPPAEANVWEKFTLPLTAETFGLDDTVFAAAMANVTSFWIRTEMHTGSDVGGIDEVWIGSTYSSSFDGSAEGWSSGGDGTMEWVSEGGYDGGFLQISDWATGDWHWLIAPSDWAGDWSAMIGQDIEFWYQTNRPSYEAIIKITTFPVNRLVITTPVSATILPDDSTLIRLEVLPTPETDITVNFSTSNGACVEVPPPVTIQAGNSSVNVYFVAASGATVGCESVIEATSSGYLTSRITMMILDNFGIPEQELDNTISVFPNPSTGKFSITNESGNKIHQLMMYNLAGNRIIELTGEDLGKREIDASQFPPGIYFLRIFVKKEVITSKVILK
jgi:hypothetical protein